MPRASREITPVEQVARLIGHRQSIPDCLTAGVLHEMHNLTPHVLNIYLPEQVVRGEGATYAAEGSEPAHTIPSTGFARAKAVAEQLPSVCLEDIEVPVVRKVFASVVEGLPEPIEGTIYVVSLLTAQAVSHREDVFFPGEAVRDRKGVIIGCVGLAHV